MLAINHRLFAARRNGGNAVRDAGDIFFIGNAERDIDMIIPTFGDETGRGRRRIKDFHKTRIVFGTATGAFGHAERRQLGRIKTAQLLEKLRIGRIGTGITALDIIHAQRIKRRRQPHFIGHGKIHAGRLLAVAHSGVKNIKAFACHHGLSFGFAL